MKSIQRIAFLSIILGILMSFTFAKTAEVKIKTTAVCGMCKQTIERNLSLTPGVKSAVLDLEDKVVTVKFNPKKISIEGIKNAISMSGYDADEVKKDMKSHAELPACCREGCNASH